MAEISRPHLVLCSAAWARHGASRACSPLCEMELTQWLHCTPVLSPSTRARPRGNPAGGCSPPPGASHMPQAGPRQLGWGSLYAVILKCYFKEIL